MNTKYYKHYIEKIINSNPVEIILKRKVKTDDGYGGFTTQEVSVPVQKFYFYKSRANREILADSGINYYSTYATFATKLLCLGDADIEEGDTLVYQGNTYRVFNVTSYFHICKQAELEVIK